MKKLKVKSLLPLQWHMERVEAKLKGMNITPNTVGLDFKRYLKAMLVERLRAK